MLNLFTNHFREDKPPGRLIDVGGFKMHIHVTGPVNEYPTVILEAGLGLPTPIFHWLQEKLSEHVHTVSYDRAGIGWSEESNQPHDAEHMVKQLHVLLEKANVKGPYVFAGHSLAGYIMRIYAHKYPEEVAGIAFLDASHPNQYYDISAIENTIAACKRVRIAALLGLTRIYNPMFNNKSLHLSLLPESAKQQLKNHFCRPSIYKAQIEELNNFAISAKQVLQTSNNLGDIPIVVMTATEHPPDPDGHFANWNELQQELSTLSSRGRHKVIEGANHITLITDKKFTNNIADEIINHLLKNIEDINSSGNNAPKARPEYTKAS